ncbi:MAG: hypothetical protein LBK62_01610 [Treponema sp.]|jgi:ABC-type glycerol-3-phosphate transport system substrate-binding protein|nr:hypothetical protein [Treponema sp.]
MIQRFMRLSVRKALPLAVMMFVLLSCSFNSNTVAVLWTDQPEFAFYGEEFNNAQAQYKIEIRYFDSLARELVRSGAHPDIVVGSWLKSASTRAYFKSLDGFLTGKGLSKNDFYSRLLAMGSIDDKQFLLPVSFNAPVLIFARDKGELLSNPFTIGFTEIMQLGKDYNIENNGVYTRMGFSPVWDDNFLYIVAALFRVSFQEADPLAWDAAALERAMSFVYSWTQEVNRNSQSGEDFYFKYFYDPPATLALSGRILFTYMSSEELFTLAEERRNGIDFRWIAEGNRIPLAGSAVYLGLPKKGKAPKAAAAFVHWFYQAETQRRLLARGKANRALETSFGISGGFSALRPVTEQIFPQFYPNLLGHMLPEDFLFPANVLPGNWILLKERVILPYLHERARSVSRNQVYPLERRLADWQRVNL